MRASVCYRTGKQPIGNALRRQLLAGGHKPLRWLVRISQAHDQFSDVVTIQQPHKGLWCLFNARHDVFAKLDLALFEPLAHLRKKFAILSAIVVEDDETLKGDALG